MKIERASELQRFGCARADPVAKISEIGRAHRQRRARHDAGAIVAKNHAAQHRRDVDRRRIEREKLRGFPRPFDPIDVLRGALFEKSDDTEARFANATAKLLQLGLEKFVLRPFHHLRDARLQCRSDAR